MKRITFDKIVTFVGFGLAILFLIFAGLLNWGASFATENVRSQLANQNIAFPIAQAMPAATKDQLAKWAGMQVTTGEMARDYSDLFILEHMKSSTKAAIGKEATYSEISGMYTRLVRGGSTDTVQIAKLEDLRQSLFMGNTLRGLLLQAYAFGTLGAIASYAALSSLIGSALFFLLSIAGRINIRRTPQEAMI